MSDYNDPSYQEYEARSVQYKDWRDTTTTQHQKVEEEPNISLEEAQLTTVDCLNKSTIFSERIIELLKKEPLPQQEILSLIVTMFMREFNMERAYDIIPKVNLEQLKNEFTTNNSLDWVVASADNDFGLQFQLAQYKEEQDTIKKFINLYSTQGEFLESIPSELGNKDYFIEKETYSTIINSNSINPKQGETKKDTSNRYAKTIMIASSYYVGENTRKQLLDIENNNGSGRF